MKILNFSLNVSIMLLLLSACAYTQPNAPNTYMGLQAQTRGDWDTAIFHFTNAIESKEVEGNYYLLETAYSGRAEAYFKKNDLNRALADCDVGIRLVGGGIELQRLRASIYDRRREFDRAIADIKSVLLFNPDGAWDHLLLGRYQGHKGNYDQSIAEFSTSIKLAPDDHSYVYERAWGNLCADRGGAAFADGDRYIEKMGTSDKNYEYAVLISYLGRKKAQFTTEADAFLAEQLKKLASDKWPVSILQFMSGSLDMVSFLKLATDNDKLTEAHTYIAESLLLDGKKSEAMLHFRWVKRNGNPMFYEFSLSVAELNRVVPVKRVQRHQK